MTAKLRITENGEVRIHYASEFDLRDGFAAYAEMAGWDAETEHVVSGWGRPDLYLTSGSSVFAVEVKLTLESAAQCRKGMQQADAYRLAMPEVQQVFLVAPTLNTAAIAPYADAYWRVTPLSCAAFISWLRVDESSLKGRAITALGRSLQANDDLRMRRLITNAVADYDDRLTREEEAAALTEVASPEGGQA